jgi:hypothetical protein
MKNVKIECMPLLMAIKDSVILHMRTVAGMIFHREISLKCSLDKGSILLQSNGCIDPFAGKTLLTLSGMLIAQERLRSHFHRENDSLELKICS